MYREVILAHAQDPLHSGKLPDATDCVHRENTSCGDAIDLCAIVKDGLLVDLRYESAGCAISTASASMMTDALIGRTKDEATALLANFRAFLIEHGDLEGTLEELDALEGVRQFPARVKCALLAWQALEEILNRE
jgi:nitrogen fixation NifU-like protein